MVMVTAMSEQIMPIESEERLAAINDAAVAAGTMKRDDARRHQRKLQEHAEETRPATTANLQDFGIEVVKNG